MRIPKPSPKLETSPQAFLTNTVVFIAILAVLAFAGVAIVCIASFFKILAAVIPSIKSVLAALVLMYLVLTMLFFALKQTSDAIRMSVGAIDHFVTRLLGFAVVGVSDMCRGSRFAAGVAYGLVLLLTLSLSVAFVVYFVEGNKIGTEAWKSLSEGGTGALSLPHLIAAGSVLSVTSVLALLPLGMMFRKRWWQMVLRPALTADARATDTPPSSAASKELRLAHLSDLHFESSSTSDVTRAAAQALQEVSGSRNIDAVVLTGDITDTGTDEQWNQFLGLPQTMSLRAKLVLVPGNHDLNPVHEHSKVRSAVDVESPTRKQTQVRAANFLRAADLVMGERCHAICPYTGAWTTLRDIMARAKPDIDIWARGERASPHATLPHELFERLFPLAVASPGLEGITFLVWNTVWLARWPINNSMGEVHQDQLKRADEVLKHLPATNAVVHLMHHQAGLPNTPPVSRDKAIGWFARSHAIGMGVRNPIDLLSWMAKRRQRTLLLHGHRHKFFVARDAEHNVTVVSCPSATKSVEMSWDHNVPCGKPGLWLELVVDINGPHCELTNVRVMRSAE